MAATAPARARRGRTAPKRGSARRVRRRHRARMPRFAATGFMVGIGLLLAADGRLVPNLGGYLLALATAVVLDLFINRA